jgi:hypothetical protein
MSGKNYYIKYTYIRDSLTTPFTDNDFIEVGDYLWKMITDFIAATEGASITMQVSVDGLSWSHLFLFPTEESRAELLSKYNEEIAKHPSIIEHHSEAGVQFEWEMYETDA